MLGYRFMGKAHSNALSRLPMFFPDAPEVELDVLIGRDESALANAAERFGFSRTATNWQDVVDEVDVFYNLGPNALHVEPSIEALDAGCLCSARNPLRTPLRGQSRCETPQSDRQGPLASHSTTVSSPQFSMRRSFDRVR